MEVDIVEQQDIRLRVDGHLEAITCIEVFFGVQIVHNISELDVDADVSHLALEVIEFTIGFRHAPAELAVSFECCAAAMRTALIGLPEPPHGICDLFEASRTGDGHR